MKSPGLLGTLTFSEKRRETLFLLQEKPRSLTEIKEIFDVTTSEILPRLKEMEASNLISNDRGNYSLTLFGEIAAMQYKPFLDTLEAIEANQEFWYSHDLSAIPKELMYRIRDLKNCKVVQSKDHEICESHKEFDVKIANAKSFKGATCIFIPSWIKLFSGLSSRGAKIDIIVTKDIYDKLKHEYAYELEQGLKNKNAHMYVCNNIKTAFATTPTYFSIAFNFKNGYYDNKYDLMGVDNASIKWGEALFKYYLENSIEIRSMEPLNDTVTQKLYSTGVVI